MAQPPADKVQGSNAIDHGGGGAHSDERIHIGGEVEQGLEAHPEVLLIDDESGDGEQKQGQGVYHGVFRAMEKGGDRPTHHMPHGQVEQGDQKYQRPDETQPHIFQVLLHGVSGGACPDLGAGRSSLGQRGSVARLHHGGDDVISGQISLPVHRHGTGE